MTIPDLRIVLAIDGRYADALRYFDLGSLGPHVLVSLPQLPPYPDDGHCRIAWVRRARELPGVERAIGVGVHPWGSHGGSIVDGVLANAGITQLAVPRRPCMPIAVDDVVTARKWLERSDLRIGSYVALEYRSFSAEPLPVEWWNEFVRLLGIPVIALAHREAPMVSGAHDGRWTNLREAKSIIADAACFVGCGSGLSVIAAALGCEIPVVENCSAGASMFVNGYRAVGDRYRWLETRSHALLIAAVRSLIGGGGSVAIDLGARRQEVFVRRSGVRMIRTGTKPKQLRSARSRRYKNARSLL